MHVLKVKGRVGSDGNLHLDLATELPPGPVELVVMMRSVSQAGDGSKYDFADLAGKFSWQGDALAMQRKLRDEW